MVKSISAQNRYLGRLHVLFTSGSDFTVSFCVYLFLCFRGKIYVGRMIRCSQRYIRQYNQASLETESPRLITSAVVSHLARMNPTMNVAKYFRLLHGVQDCIANRAEPIAICLHNPCTFSAQKPLLPNLTLLLACQPQPIYCVSDNRLTQPVCGNPFTLGSGWFYAVMCICTLWVINTRCPYHIVSFISICSVVLTWVGITENEIARRFRFLELCSRERWGGLELWGISD